MGGGKSSLSAEGGGLVRVGQVLCFCLLVQLPARLIEWSFSLF